MQIYVLKFLGKQNKNTTRLKYLVFNCVSRCRFSRYNLVVVINHALPSGHFLNLRGSYELHCIILQKNTK